jgi:hypothetical protein
VRAITLDGTSAIGFGSVVASIDAPEYLSGGGAEALERPA